MSGASTGSNVTASTVSDLTSFLKGKLGNYLISTSYTSIMPMGKDKSLQKISSQKQSQMGQDFDTKSYVSGGVPLKTYTYPDNIAKVVMGDTGLVKDIQINGTFLGIGELKIIISNFYDSNDLLRQLGLNTQGIMDINSIDSVLGIEQYIIDKITYDYAQNGTIVEGRAVL